jgi:membrane-associated phospholipid phosphatase
MLTPALSGDTHDFRVVNDWARDTSWLHGSMIFVAKDGIAFFALALLAGWWIARRARSPRRVALAVWGALAALIAVAVAQPISHAADERRPFEVASLHALTLIHHSSDPGFPSDHATAAGAITAALFFVSWRLGLVTAFGALLLAFSRVYVGVHFPQDVVAGLALGAAVAVAGVFVIVPGLARLATWLAGTPVRPLICAGGPPSEPATS